MPEPLPSRICPDCGAPVIWGLTKFGKRMPLDAEPSPNGSMEVWFNIGFRSVRYVKPEDRVGRSDLRVPHWAVCPAAVERRKGRNGEGEAAAADPAAGDQEDPSACEVPDEDEGSE